MEDKRLFLQTDQGLFCGKLSYDENAENPLDTDEYPFTFYLSDNYSKMFKGKTIDTFGFNSLSKTFQKPNDETAAFMIYKYEHGNVAFSLGDFGDKFDSGVIGWAVVSKEELQNHIIIGDNWQKDAEKMLETLLNRMTDYANGDLYKIVFYNVYIKKFSRESTDEEILQMTFSKLEEAEFYDICESEVQTTEEDLIVDYFKNYVMAADDDNLIIVGRE